jgi:hypothetical protein
VIEFIENAVDPKKREDAYKMLDVLLKALILQ